jgi:hypothetical protein
VLNALLAAHWTPATAYDGSELTRIPSLAIYPWNANNTDKLHHFIVFHDEQSAQASLDRFRGLFHVASLLPDPILRVRRRLQTHLYIHLIID